MLPGGFVRQRQSAMLAADTVPGAVPHSWCRGRSESGDADFHAKMPALRLQSLICRVFPT